MGSEESEETGNVAPVDNATFAKRLADIIQRSTRGKRDALLRKGLASSVSDRGERELSGASPRSWAVHQRRRGPMAKQIVMDATGDTKYEFNPANAEALREAERRFKELTGAGYFAAVRTSNGRSELLRNFNPAAEETVFFPQLKGG